MEFYRGYILEQIDLYGEGEWVATRSSSKDVKAKAPTKSSLKRKVDALNKAAA